MAILTREKRKAFVKKVDDMVKSPWWLEPWDSFVADYGLEYLDTNYGDKVPSVYHDEIIQAVDMFIVEDWEGIVTVVTPDVINHLIDIPGIDEDTEGLLITYTVKAVFEFVKHLATKKAADAVK